MTEDKEKNEDLPGIYLADSEQLCKKRSERLGYPDPDCLAKNDPEMEELAKNVESLTNEIVNEQTRKGGWSGPATRQSSKFHQQREKKTINAVIRREWETLADKNAIPNHTKSSTTKITPQKACTLIQPHDNEYRKRVANISAIFQRCALMLGHQKDGSELPPETEEQVKNELQKLEALCGSLAGDIKRTLVNLNIHNIGFFPGM
jgi:hypothetical protein